MRHHAIPLLAAERHALVPAEPGLLSRDLGEAALLKGRVGVSRAAAGAAVERLAGGVGGAEGEGVEGVVDAAGV